MFKDLYEMTCMLFHLYGDVYRYVSHDIWVGSALRLLGPNADLLLFLFRFVGLWDVPFI